VIIARFHVALRPTRAFFMANIATAASAVAIMHNMSSILLQNGYVAQRRSACSSHQSDDTPADGDGLVGVAQAAKSKALAQTARSRPPAEAEADAMSVGCRLSAVAVTNWMMKVWAEPHLLLAGKAGEGVWVGNPPSLSYCLLLPPPPPARPTRMPGHLSLQPRRRS